MDPSVHPTKDTLPMQGLIKLAIEHSFTTSGGSLWWLAEETQMLTAEKRLRKDLCKI
jgi:hypothetical protein